MKKTVCVLAALIVLFASCAQAESAGSGPLYTLDIMRDGTSLVFSGPDFPGLAVTLSESDAEAVPPFVTELLLSAVFLRRLTHGPARIRKMRKKPGFMQATRS